MYVSNKPEVKAKSLNTGTSKYT